MKRLLALSLFTLGLLMAGEVLAAERAVTLKLENTCPTCGYIIKNVLGQVSGVEKVTYCSQDEIATMVFDDGKTDVETLIVTTTDVGFPVQVVE